MRKDKLSIFLLLVLIIYPFFSVNAGDRDKWFAKDKYLHFGISFALETLSYNYLKKNAGFSDSELKTAAVFTTLTIGTCKELIDKKFSWKDMCWNAAGTGIGLSVLIKF